jgi:hypothetical protein
MNKSQMDSQIKTAQTLIDQGTTWVAEELLRKLLKLQPTNAQKMKINEMLSEIQEDDDFDWEF